ncbi:hypothetical protein [Actinoplanes xinjiangensis]|uniref:Uncharacterized protein n=1 Tax=Actinoplanes xinjiangensis TaxID=512350 RepID=A0A316F7H2_9ACTN|nr:hypothetical protein [Actinoplanes xinjiangensis]PWK40205.1 hypothetical protein BC793_120144 [Actinoplanes xinjiangensis]GIF42520.1 hypothetical protein Axi01nite_68310 [Actinoplanes xinjiangensis]
MTVGYRLPAEQIAATSRAFLTGPPRPAQRPGRPGRFVAVIVRDGHPLADVGRAVETAVFEPAFGNDATVMSAEYGPYENRSLFFVVLDRRTGLPAGATRVIAGVGAEVKTIADAPAHIGRSADEIVDAHGMRDQTVWDFATVAVLPHYRGTRYGLTVSSLLYRAFAVAATHAGVEHAVVMLDVRAWRNMTLIGNRLYPLAGSAPFAYLGSADTRALYARIPDFVADMTRQAAALRGFGTGYAGRIPGRGWRKLVARRVAANVSHRLATGDTLDQNIVHAI